MAISVLTVSFLGIVSLLSRSIFYSRYVSDIMKATYLASEGIEIVKNLIDNNIALALAGEGGGWGSCFAGKGTTDFEVDYTTTNCSSLRAFSGQGSNLLFNNDTSLYGYSTGAGAMPTNFTREIRIKENGIEITVNSIVRWNTGPITSQSINMEGHFYNWQLGSVSL